MIEKISEMARARNNAGAMSIKEKYEALAAAYSELEKAFRAEVACGFAVEDETGGLVEFPKCHPAIYLGLAADPKIIGEFQPE